MLSDHNSLVLTHDDLFGYFSQILGDKKLSSELYIELSHALKYANWLSDRFGKPPVYHLDSLDKEDRSLWIVTIIPGAAEKGGFCLPTEAEWEYAARGGPNQYAYRYAGSDDLDAVAWYFGNSDTLGVQRTRPVATRAPLVLSPEYRLFDMTGNVWEWCWGWYHVNYYAQFADSIADNPNGPKFGKYRVLRGGSWLDGDINCRLAIRYWYQPNYGGNHFGVRWSRH
ncbi:MAG: formylglycine-generating enzyme family protein [Saprospirales bacterium]|nr:formylglycine-generating enzyme family protein [Saprospirales bacterium]